mgnify:CR=1 FL=1
MKSVKQHITAFAELGDYLSQIDSENTLYSPLMEIGHQSKPRNGWFTEENCLSALKNWGKALNENALNQWISPYKFAENGNKNIPHTFLSINCANLHNVS